jgi:hypothetical protein
LNVLSHNYIIIIIIIIVVLGNVISNVATASITIITNSVDTITAVANVIITGATIATSTSLSTRIVLVFYQLMDAKSPNSSVFHTISILISCQLFPLFLISSST